MGILGCNIGEKYIPMRHTIASILFMGILIAYLQRIVLSMSIVEMSKEQTSKHHVPGAVCPLPEGETQTVIKKIEGGKKDWDENVQGALLYSFYVGYVPFHFPAGYICDKYGAKIPFLVSCYVSTIITFLSPLTVEYLPWPCFALLRAIGGASQAVVFPAVTALLSRWIPFNERSLVGGVVYTSSNVGAVLGNLGTGLLIQYFESWVLPYYLWGAIGAVFIIPVHLYVYSGPEEHPHLKEKELQYIVERVKIKSKMKAPIKSIVLDPAVWALLFSQIGHNYLVFWFVSNYPKYLNNVLKYNMKINAYASSFPYLWTVLATFISGAIADKCIAHNANIRMMRVIYCVICNGLSPFCILMASYANCNRILALIFFCLSLFLMGPFFSGVKINCMDITKNHTGFVLSIYNGLGGLAAIAGPLIVSHVAYDNTLEQWHIVFWTIFLTGAVTVILYSAMCSGKRRMWDLNEEEKAAYVKPKKPKHWYQENYVEPPPTPPPTADAK